MACRRSRKQKARAILETQASCLGCHELDGEGGRLGPSLTLIHRRRSAAYIRAVIENPRGVNPASSMPKPMMPAASLDLITRYLARNASNDPGPDIRPQGARAPYSDAALYRRWCAGCHGPLGKGDGPNARFLPVKPAAHADSAAMSKRPDDSLYDAIAGGGAVMGKSPRMPAFGETLAPSEIRQLVSYIRALCSCAGPAWSRDGAKPPSQMNAFMPPS